MQNYYAISPIKAYVKSSQVLLEEVLKDKVLCSALVDRLCHKSYLVNMTGTSYRIKETKKYLKKE